MSDKKSNFDLSTGAKSLHSFSLQVFCKPQDTQCCIHDWDAAFGLLPDVGTVAKETHRQQNKDAGITVSLARKQQVTGSADRARVRCEWKSGKAGRPYGAGASPALILAVLALVPFSLFVRQFPPIQPSRRSVPMQDPRSYGPSSPFVTKSTPEKFPQPAALESAPLNTATVTAHTLPDAKALPALEWILSPKSRAVEELDRTRELQDDEPDAIRERILSRMALQSAKEEHVHFYDDRQIALITVIKATRGDATPYADAVRSVLPNLCCHPDDVFARVTQNRKDKLGKEYRLWYDAAGNLRPDIPKIEAARERRRVRRKKAA